MVDDLGHTVVVYSSLVGLTVHVLTPMLSQTLLCLLMSLINGMERGLECGMEWWNGIMLLIKVSFMSHNNLNVQICMSEQEIVLTKLFRHCLSSLYSCTKKFRAAQKRS